MSRAEALWKSGGRSLPVFVLSAPDVQGMVEVEFHWSGQRQRVRSGVLFEPNEEAKRLLGYADRFVTITSQRLPPPTPSKSLIVRAPVPPLPGARIDRAAAGPLFNLKAVPLDARLRLVGKADGKVALMVKEETYTPPELPPPALPSKPQAGVPPKGSKPAAAKAGPMTRRQPSTRSSACKW